MEYIGPFRGATYFMSLYYRSRFHYVLPTNGFEYDFPTAQHAVEAAKCQNSTIARSMIIACGDDPKRVHLYGKNHPATPLYNNLFLPMLEEILVLKFPGNSTEQNFVLSQRLMDTGDSYIVYFNYWHDNKLGVCACNRCNNGKIGLNLLGLMLMDRREVLLSQAMGMTS